MNRVVIIGGGFAGLWAARRLSRRRDVECILLDRRDTFDFLPVLPDVVGGRVQGRHLTRGLDSLARRHRFTFRRSDVPSVDLAARTVTTDCSPVSYDFLLIAAGSGPNFYGRSDAQRHAFTVSSVSDAMCTARALEGCRTVVICGGGYTGLEVAGNVRARFNRQRCEREIILVEMTDSILPGFEPWLQEYCLRQMKRLGVEVAVKTTVSEVDSTRVTLSDGRHFEGAALVWTAGVHTASFVRDLPVQKDKQGRLMVDRTLSIAPRCYAAGDSAHFEQGGKLLRMGVQFSIEEGTCAARNILREIDGMSPLEFKPWDPGFLVPIANGSSAGYVVGRNVSGFAATLLHYALCIFRSSGLRNRMGITRELLHGRLTHARGV